MSATAERRQTQLWRTEDPVFSESGRIIKGGMFPSQRAWWELPNFVRGFVGGYGSGKTRQLCKRMIALALHNAPAPVAIVSPTMPVAEETTIATLYELLDGKSRHLRSQGENFTFSHRKKSPQKFTICYHGRRGQILIYPGEEPNRLKGPNLSGAGLDEPFIQPIETFEQILARVRHPEAQKLEINLAGTPEQLNWGYDLFEGDLAKKHDVGLVQCSTLENKALSEKYVERLLEAYDEKVAQAYVHGLFVNLAKGQVYYGFSRLENVVSLPIPDWVELGVGMDFNVHPMAAVVFWHDKASGHIHVFDEVELPNSNTAQMCSLLRERYWDLGLREVYPDPSGKNRSTSNPEAGRSDYTAIIEHGFKVNAWTSHMAERDKWNSVNARFAPYKGAIRLTISPSCKKLIKYLSVYSHELRNKQDKEMSHLLDALAYGVSFLYPLDRTRSNTRKLWGI